MKTNTLSPFGKAQSFALPCQAEVSPHVATLALLRGPFAIVRGISFIDVASLQCQSMRASTHVCDEVTEVFPSFADCYSAASIITKSLVAWILTSAASCGPCRILFRHLSLYCCAVSDRVLVFQASAAFGITSQITRGHKGLTPAIALALPDDVTADSRCCRRNRCQFTTAVSGEVSRRSTVCPSHAVSSSVGDGAVRGWRAVMTFASLANYPTLVAV